MYPQYPPCHMYIFQQRKQFFFQALATQYSLGKCVSDIEHRSRCLCFILHSNFAAIDVIVTASCDLSKHMLLTSAIFQSKQALLALITLPPNFIDLLFEILCFSAWRCRQNPVYIWMEPSLWGSRFTRPFPCLHSSARKCRNLPRADLDCLRCRKGAGSETTY